MAEALRVRRAFTRSDLEVAIGGKWPTATTSERVFAVPPPAASTVASSGSLAEFDEGTFTEPTIA